MTRIGLFLAMVVTACAPAAVAPSATPPPTVEPTATAAPIVTATPATAAPTPPPVVQTDPSPTWVPVPDVALKAQTFPMGTPPTALRVPLPQTMAQIPTNFGGNLTDALNAWRRRSASDDEWNGRIWPGAFQKVARDAVAAHSDQSHFFEVDQVIFDAAWALAWNVPTGAGTSTALQFIDLTMKFRDHGATLPPEDVAYVWHLRLPVTNQNVYAISDGYDDVHAKTWMNTATYWDQPRLEKEATSALSGYLWNESYRKGAYTPQFGNAAQGTPFWQSRNDALTQLAGLFGAGRLTDRHFEGAAVRIDSFEPLTVYGGGIVTVTLTGQRVQTLDGRTTRFDFTEPMKFFRFANSPVQLSGWTAIDAFQEGAWVSGGDLALDKLNTVHG